jgi:hypothetical protein
MNVLKFFMTVSFFDTYVSLDKKCTYSVEPQRNLATYLSVCIFVRQYQ